MNNVKIYVNISKYNHYTVHKDSRLNISQVTFILTNINKNDH